MHMNIHKFDELLKTQKIVVSLAPTYKIAYGDKTHLVLDGIKKLGIDIISETINGYHIILNKINCRLMTENYLISEACPLIKNIIEKKYPRLKNKLDGYSSPLNCHCSFLKSTIEDATIIFVGPCKNKKIEAKKDLSANICLTYEELYSILIKKNLLNSVSGDLFDFRYKVAKPKLEFEIIEIDGIDNVINFLNKLDEEEITPFGYINLFYCIDGCMGKTIKNKID